MTSKKRQLSITFPNTWGGRRKSAGRPRLAPRPRVPHTRRPKLASRFPVHVTVRLRAGLPRLRGFELAKVLRRAFVHGCDAGVFRICQFSVQGNHIHLVCEARDKTALSRGVQGFKVRVARGLNRHWGRNGTVFDDRYHAEIMKTPRHVRNTLLYVLHNGARHGEKLPRWASGIDPFSSAWYFDGWRDTRWRNGLSPPPNEDSPPVAQPHTWLLATGWRRAGLLGVTELPAAAARS